MRRTSLAVLAALAATAAAVPSFPSPPAVQVGEQVVVGLSSGAFMAVQYQVAYSSQLVGAGVVAGGPYYCAQDSLTTAETSCMSQPEGLSVSASVQAAQSCAQSGNCDSVSNLAKQRSWLFSGTQDTVVDPGVMQKLAQFYSALGVPSSSVETVFNVDAEHCWPTSDFGGSCTTLGSPYISNCDYDASLKMMSFLLNRTLSTSSPNSGSYYQLSQDSAVPSGTSNAAAISMGPLAYAYVPSKCAGGSSACPLVISFHGCQQGVGAVGLDFVQNTQMVEVAEGTGLVVLFPQAIPSYWPISNANGCWDWFGYTTSDYANKNGPQMATVQNLVRALAGKSAPSASA